MVGFVEDGVEMATEMPFGKHKGRPLHDLPGEYLHWLAGRELSGWLADAPAMLERNGDLWNLGPSWERHRAKMFEAGNLEVNGAQAGRIGLAKKHRRWTALR
jgi:hypothetical protein